MKKRSKRKTKTALKQKRWWISDLRPKPCPFCGWDELYVGPLGSLTFGVQCWNYKKQKGCGVKMAREMPDRRPRGIKTMEELDRYTCDKAIEAWNKRAISFFYPWDR